MLSLPKFQKKLYKYDMARKSNDGTYVHMIIIILAFIYLN